MTALKDENGTRPIIFFDGVCHLCNGFVDFLITQDSSHTLRFAPLQGVTAKALLPITSIQNLDSVVLYQQGQIFRGSEAILRTLTQLGGVYRLSSVFFIVPRFVRDFIYRVVAQHRYQWFGEREFCRLPQSHEKEFLLP